MAVTHIPTKVANKSHHPGRRLPPFPRPLRRPRVRRPLHDSSFPAPPLRRPRVRRPLHDSSFPAPPFVVPAKAGTQRNGHSQTNQGRQHPPHLVAAFRRPHGVRRPLHDSSFPRLPLVVPAYGDLCMTRRFPPLPLVVPAQAGTQRNRHSHINQGRQQPLPLVAVLRSSRACPSSFPRTQEPSATVTRIPTKVANSPHP